MGRVAGKVALVTGGGSGMGKAIAQLLSAEGARIVVTDINEEAGRQTAEQIRQNGGESVFLKHDVAATDDWKRVVAASMAQFGKIDVLVNNAGMLIFKSVQDTEEAEWDRVMAVNAKSVYLGCKHILPAMQAAGKGSIINISSAYGMVGAAGCAVYVASKGASRLLTKAAAADLNAFGIRVNSLHPGLIATEMTKDIVASPDILKVALGSAIMERAGRPEEVAAAVLFLASDESSYMTGSELVVDGGMTTR